jgi:hypothetical protein
MADDRVKADQKLTADELHRVWQGRLTLARRHLEKYGDTDGRWRDNVHALAGDFNSEEELGEEAIDVNMVRSTIKSTLPPLYVNTPEIVPVPTVPTVDGANNVENARLTGIELNYWMRELDVRQEVKEITYDGEMTNVGYAYVGWAKAKDVKAGEGPVEYSDKIREDQPFVRRISPKNVLVPPGYKNLHEAPWVSVIFTKPLLHVQRKFGERADEVPTRDYRGEWDDHANLSDQLRTYLECDDARLVDVHNIWDKETKKVLIAVVGHDKFLEEPEDWPWEVEGVPLERYQPDHISDEYYGSPPTSQGLPQNKELNATRTAMRKNRNRTKQVVFVASDQADLAEKYAQADDGEVITVDNQGEDLRSKIMVVPGLQLDGGDLAYDSVIKADMRESWGQGSERRGSGDPNVDSATASANIEKGIQIRESDKSDAVRTLWLGIARKLWMVLKQHPNIKRTRLIAGNNAGEYAKINYTLKALHGEYSFRMDLGAMTVITPQERQARARINYNLLRADPRVDPDRLILDLLDANQTPDPSSYLMTLRQPAEEHEMMMVGLPVEANERDDHIDHIAKHDAQEEMWNEILMRIAAGQNGETNPMQLRIQLAQALMIAHGQDHMRYLQQIQGAQGGAGQPVAENLLRKDSQIQSGAETEAELTGQPLTRPG